MVGQGNADLKKTYDEKMASQKRDYDSQMQLVKSGLEEQRQHAAAVQVQISEMQRQMTALSGLVQQALSPGMADKRRGASVPTDIANHHPIRASVYI